MPKKIAGKSNATPSVIKEALFQMIQNRAGSQERSWFFDLFGGSGQIGFEAYSRGFAEVWIGEINKERFNDLVSFARENTDNGKLHLSNSDAMRLLKKLPELTATHTPKPDHIFIFADPPYGHNRVRGKEKQPLPAAIAEQFVTLNLTIPATLFIQTTREIGESHFDENSTEGASVHRYGNNLIIKITH